jgi:hypothetical protein
VRQTLYDRQSTEYRTMTRNMLLIRTDSSPDCASSMTLHRMCHFPLVKERTFVVSSVTCRCRRNYSVAGLRRATVLSRYRKGSFFHAREVLWTRPLFFFLTDLFLENTHMQIQMVHYVVNLLTVSQFPLRVLALNHRPPRPTCE